MTGDLTQREWPLVVFTLGVQVACGMLIAAVLADTLAGPGGAGAVRLCGVLVFPMVAIAVVGSLFHLGRPAHAWRSMSNLAQSRLSREVLLTALFAAAALPYSLMWYGDTATLRVVWGAATVVLGLAAVWSSSSIYTVPARPVWNSGWVPTSFFGATLLLAGSVSAGLVQRTGPQAILTALAAAMFAGSMLQIISAFWMIATASAVADRASRSTGADLGLDFHRLAYRWEFALHLVLAGLAPAALAVWMSGAVRSGGVSVNGPVLVLALVVPLAGIALGRRLMFSLGISIPRF